MKKLSLKYLISGIVLAVLLIPIITSSILDLEQKKANEARAEQERIQKEAERVRELKIYLMGKFDQTEREDFVLIPHEFATVPNPMYLRQETLDAFLKMAAAAKEEGISIKIASATRNFTYQKGIWDDKWTGATLVEGKSLPKSTPDKEKRFAKILEYSAVPGTSRHHWGTDIDLNDANPAYFNTAKGKEMYAWMVANASRFGFCEPYNEKGSGRPTGYNEEKWHWSYKPLSKTFTEEYKNLIVENDISGFLGDEYVPAFNLINNYVLDINPECL